MAHELCESSVGGDHPEFNDSSRWPRRLLHVPTMTSYKWSPGNKYHDTVEPRYIAVSYTWGRFALAEGESPLVKPLPIQGVDWSIPRVNPETHFSATDFERLIGQTMVEPRRHYSFTEYRVRQRTWKRRIVNTFHRFVEQHARVFKFLWLDIACIDQRWTEVTMLEIGRQARIFSHAEHSYVWLSKLEETMLRPSLLNLNTALYALQREPWQKERALDFQSRPWLRMAIDSLTTLMKDPWFSSLWTLQEAFLCPDAIVLSRDSKGVLDITQVDLQPWRLHRIFGFVNDLILWSERSFAPRAEPEFTELMDLIQQSGLAALWLNTPMALLGVSYTRQTTRSLDRVYGIMQTLSSDFQVGLARKDADQSRVYTLPELEDEFGATVVKRYPVLSQMHVYLIPPDLGKGWCLRGNSAVPMIAERGDLFGWDNSNRIEVNMDRGCTVMCTVSTLTIHNGTWARLVGRACSFVRMQEAWGRANRSPLASRLLRSNWRMHRSSRPSIQMVAMDRGTPFSPDAPELKTLNVIDVGDNELQLKLIEWILLQPGAEDLRVFLLGQSHIQDDVFYTAMLLTERVISGITHWRRVGICMWITSHLQADEGDYVDKAFLTANNDDWQPLEGLFG